uniref:Uncharacterized protein n=1 Tax=Dicentrarchus labrax TaxID=13489 RepID=A0A8P4G879_DICLA
MYILKIITFEGHCAKFGRYTIMDMRSNTVIVLQLVQSNEVGGSYHMEKECLKRSVALLEERGVTIDSIVTDRHPQIQKFLREDNITHYYDVWHMEKGLSKKLSKISQNKECEKLIFWNVYNVFSILFSILLFFLPRLYLAALHFNENADRPQATTSAGEPLFRLHFPKWKKGECTAKPVKEQPTFHYVDEILDLVFEKVFTDPYADEVLKISIPEDLSAQFERPDKKEVIDHYVTRFSQGPV